MFKIIKLIDLKSAFIQDVFCYAICKLVSPPEGGLGFDNKRIQLTAGIEGLFKKFFLTAKNAKSR
jgi:hypothetical protein